MGFFDKLKSLFNVNKVEIRLFEVHINSNNVSKKIECNEGNKTLNINLQELESGERKKVKQIINSAVKDEDCLLLEDKSKKIIDDFKLKDKKSENQEILNYLKDKIPPDDHKALRASLYLREKFREGGDVSHLKRDIMEKYGERGKNISNLCTAGYFENWIIPLYGEMSKEPDFTLDEFLKVYNIVIKEAAFSVFVHREMSGGEVKKAILGKIETSEKYNIKFTNIHGIGKSNVKKIRNVIMELETERDFKKRIEEKNSTIMVRLNLT
ncbi:hypothetical protein ES705_06484 [subsurface metagenome]|nr:hypothetical protein [Clostridia bacterium]